MNRKLELRRETLAELGSDDLRLVAGANAVQINAIMHTLDHTCITCQTSVNTRCDA